jgi:hypothetical protein
MPAFLRSSVLRDRRGVAALELALIAPVLLLLITATIDVVRYANVVLTLNRTAANVSDLATQFDTLSASMTVVHGNEVGVLFQAAKEVARPLDLMTAGTVIVTSVANMGAGSRVMWQQKVGKAASNLGVTGGIPVLPSGFAQRTGDNAVFTEVFYPYTPYLLSAPWLGIANPLTVLYARAVYQPRLGTLTALEPAP